MKETLKKIKNACLQSEFKWRLSNFTSWASYSLNRPRLHEEALRVLWDLDRDGIAATTVEKFFPDLSLWKELQEKTASLEAGKSKEIAEARANAEKLGQSKSFIFQLLGENPAFDASDICSRFVFHESIKGLADAYMGLRTVLKFYNIWHTFKIEGEPRRSQLWHQDPEDHFIFRVFAYMSDVDEGAGPLMYVAGSHPKGRKIQPEYFKEPGHGAKRSTDEQMKKVAPESRWIKAVGPAGTLIFADTRGYHKGGLARTKDRIVYNAMFTSPSCKISSYHN